jgi:MAP3K TRAFs-binding domain
MSEKKTCFVIMGFGKKTDYQTGRVLDLDASYKNMIKPAVEEAGLKCIRADEIVHAGVIDVPMYDQIFTADVVVADLSTANSNAFYELGVRHALRPFTTIIIAEDQFVYPFDVNHSAIRKYRHLGEDIGASEARRFIALLKEAIQTIAENPPDDSPVYTYLRDLPRPDFANRGGGQAAEAVAPPAVAAASSGASSAASAASPPDPTLSVLMEQAKAAQGRSDFATAKNLLTLVRDMMKPKGQDDPRQEDPYIIQQLALATYKSEQPTPQEALEEARELLKTLTPETSNDTETLGLWGAVHKRLWDLTGEVAYLDEAVRGYERGFYLRNDYYNGINLAFLLNVRADNAASRAEAVADFVQAERVRREVINICLRWLESDAPPISRWLQERLGERLSDAKYWVMATLAEAHAGIGDEAGARKWFDAAEAGAPEQWMLGTTKKQMSRLRELLGRSPLKYVKEDGE